MRMRKLFAGVIAAATMLGGLALGASTANAADGTPVTGNATFTFTASSADQLTGRDITAYKIGDYVQYGSGDSVAYGVSTSASVKDAEVIKTALGAAGNSLQKDYLTNALAAGLLDASTVRPWDTTDNATTESTTRQFANNLATAINLAKLTAVTPAISLGEATKVDGATGDDIYAATVQLPAGIYLFVDNTQATASITKAVPMIVASGEVNTDKQLVNPTKDATVNFKNTKNEDQTKKVDEGSASIGDTLNYTLTGKVSNPAPASFVFTDRPGTGLTIKADTEFTVTADGQAVPTNDYMVGGLDTDLVGDGAKTFTVTLNNLEQYAGKTITVKYTATINDEAAGQDGVVNGIQKNDGSYDETTKTKLYGFDFTKTDAAGKPVYNADAEKNVQFQVKSGDTVLKFIAKDGTYYKAADQNSTSATDTLVTNAQGLVKVGGLADGIYTVEETKVADGFQDFKATFTVTITNGVAVFSTTATSDPFDLVNTTDKTVKNVKSITQLPLTGAAGTAMFTVIGLLLAGAAATVALKSRETKRALRA
ncbi:isopeptide-forming domain-containing fimbrial protein [Bifidobacterium scardovii]|uniref:isopeptide-forming domain-containing fimbrial protein n=1 Tax=Bifidobacterium scardovii TaxID=158787 RepID=UPI0029167A43|nr:isopeptide-forming domain-containing fimbrial protein [Bifidobacterium scardovii]